MPLFSWNRIQESGPRVGRGHQAIGRLARELMAMSGNEVVRGVAHRTRQDGRDPGEMEPPTEVRRHPERRVRAQQHPLAPLVWPWLQPHDRVRPGKLGVAGTHLGPERALQRGEPQRAAPVVSQDELNALGAETAGTVVEKDGRHRQPLNVSQFSGRPDSKPRRNQLMRCSDEPWVNASGVTA